MWLPVARVQVLRCLRSLINVEQGMQAMLGVYVADEENESGRPSARLSAREEPDGAPSKDRPSILWPLITSRLMPLALCTSAFSHGTPYQ